MALTSADASNSPLTLPVTLTVQAAAPAITVSSFKNAASFAAGTAAPNTIMSAFGTFPGCTSGAQVLIDGTATEVFASAPAQINFLIPAGVAGKASTSVQIACAGLTSAPAALAVTNAMPAIFTASQNGTGQAASVNQDGSTSMPAAAGTVVQVYGTGFGLCTAAGADGLQWVALPVTATIGGVPAAVAYAGRAPGYSSGLQQIDVAIPASTARGSQALQLTVGGASTQAGVTLAIQ